MTTIPPRRRPAPHRVGRRPAGAHPRLLAGGAMVRSALIYQIPVYEIHHRTGMILLYDEAGRIIGSTASLELPHQGTPRIVFDYVGQTVRTAEQREAEHADDKPWADLIAGRIQVIVQGVWTKADRDEAELRAIRIIKPRFNHDGNLDNPRRIEIWRQIELRHARDRAAGRPLWAPPQQRIAVPAIRPGAGMQPADPQPRYPLEVIWAGLKALGRGARRLPAPVRTAGLLFVAAVVMILIGTGLLTVVGWPQAYAAAFSTMLAIVCIGLLPGRHKRRRRRRR